MNSIFSEQSRELIKRNRIFVDYHIQVREATTDHPELRAKTILPRAGKP